MNDQVSRVATSIAPWLAVRKGAEAVEFYKAAFAAVEQFRIDSETGHVVARLSVDEAEFWVSDESPEQGNFSPATVGGSTCRIILTVDDPDAMSDVLLRLGRRLSRVSRSNTGRILVTCDNDNIGSIRTIEKNGGILENVVDGPDLDKPKRCYWIELR
jgi:PhnB protein